MGTHDWDLSSNGEIVAFTVDFTDAVSFVRLDSGELRQVPLIPAFSPQFVEYAPDGHLVLAGYDRGKANVLAMSDLDGHDRILATRQGWIFRPFLSPNGRKVMFGERRFDRRLWMLESQAPPDVR
jgi:hypothetical protein